MLRHALQLRSWCQVCSRYMDNSQSLPLEALPRLPNGELDATECLNCSVCPVCCERVDPEVFDLQHARTTLYRLGWQLTPRQCAPASAALPFDWILP